MEATRMDEVISYREATVKDAPTICELGQLLNSVHHAARPDIYAASTPEPTRDLPHWMVFFENTAQIVFIAHVGLQAAGFITASISSSSGPLMEQLSFVRIGSVCVAEKYWGKSIGRGLVQNVQKWAAERDAKDIRLSVWAFNAPAIRLYAELGFEIRAFERGLRL